MNILKPLTDFLESTDSCFATGLPRVVGTVSGESNDYFAGGCLALKKIIDIQLLIIRPEKQ